MGTPKAFVTIAALTLAMAGCTSPKPQPKPELHAIKADARFSADSYDLKDLDVMIRPIRLVQPIYPRHLIGAGISGRAMIAAVIDTDGVPRDMQCVEATDISFADAAIAAMAQWRFAPGQKNGKPVPARIIQPMEFSVQE